MKKLCVLLASVCFILSATAQDETEKQDSKDQKNKSDTIRMGNVTIITSKGKRNHDSAHHHNRHGSKPKNVNTSWFTLDLGFNNYTDNTNYSSLDAQQFAPGATKDWFELRPVKSVNVNIWIITQRLNLIRHAVNLQYGLGLELNNYHYEEEIRFRENPTSVYLDQIRYRKNKLATDYITIPVMLNFNLTPKSYEHRSIGFSVGVSAGYLYSSRQKYISDETGKEKLKDDFDLRPFKISYVGELKMGPIKLYGSLATESIFEKGLDQTPYTFGIRFSHD
ncbi:MAG: outer membrane beta-barrel protein [Chitinophagaceae bacterium]|nr:outer membrane beta-barrel protein [Chitinophagaceae bacterium]